MSDLRSRANAAIQDGAREIAKAGISMADVPSGEQIREMTAGEPADSGIEASMDVPVHVAWSRVMGEVQFIAKNRRTDMPGGDKRNYNYRGIDDVMNAVAGSFRKHGVFVMPSGVEPSFEVVKTSSGSAMNYARIVCHFTIYGPKGDTMPGAVLGEGFDSGDKSGTKAQSVAYRTFLIEALAIPVKRPEYDTEHGPQYEIAGPQRPTVAEYAAMILDEGTSVARLSQIMQEVDADRTLGPVEVELVDGERVSLSRLVRRVGQKRKSQEG